MPAGKKYNFRATVVAYIGTGLVVALLIHFIVLSSPKYNWIFPVTTTSSTTINPAPGEK